MSDITINTKDLTRDLSNNTHEIFPNGIFFHNDLSGKWVMKITEEGIFFNRQQWQNAEPNEFAKAVIHILENSYSVKFERKNPAYDKNLS